MAEQLTLNQLVGSSSLPRLTTPARTNENVGSLRRALCFGLVPLAVPLQADDALRPRIVSVRSVALPNIASVRFPYRFAEGVMLA